MDDSRDPWDIQLPDGETQGWRVDPYLWAFLDDSALTTDPVPDNPNVPRSPDEPAPSTILESIPWSGFLSVPDETGRTVRKDGLYRSSSAFDDRTIIFSYHVAPMEAPEQSMNGNETAAPINSISSLTYSVRLLFPISREANRLFGWRDTANRNVAAETVENSLSKLASNGSLAACLAGAQPQQLCAYMKGDGKTLRLHLASLLRYSRFANDPDGQPVPTFTPYRSKKPVSMLGGVKLRDEQSSIALRELHTEVQPSNWLNGETVKVDDGSSLKPLPHNTRLALYESELDSFEWKLKYGRSVPIAREYGVHRCVMGDRVLWGPDETSTVASSSSAAAN